MLVINDPVSAIPDIIIVQIIKFTSAHIICVPFLSVVVLKLKLDLSPRLLIFTKTAVNQVLGNIVQYLLCINGITICGGEYQAATLPIIVQMTAPFVCGYTHDYILDL